MLLEYLQGINRKDFKARHAVSYAFHFNEHEPKHRIMS